MSAPTIQAIETEYAGCRFRSRLEARWAVFFDQLNIHWQYEVEGFVLDDGSCYLPDFYLPDMCVWVEVKGGDDALAADLDRIRAFARSRREHLVVLGDLPAFAESGVPCHPMIVSVQDFTQDVVGIVVDSGPTWAFVPLWADFGEAPTTRPRYIKGITAEERVRHAYLDARGARFEHGERG